MVENVLQTLKQYCNKMYLIVVSIVLLSYNIRFSTWLQDSGIIYQFFYVGLIVENITFSLIEKKNTFYEYYFIFYYFNVIPLASNSCKYIYMFINMQGIYYIDIRVKIDISKNDGKF